MTAVPKHTPISGPNATFSEAPSIEFARLESLGLVSIVTPTRCGERFIGDALASIGRQTYAHWELIVVEDGSNGPTQQIVQEFARRHPSKRVDYIRNDRSYGAAHSRNVAFAKAAGQYVALLDCDDRWLPEHLAVSVDAFHSTGADIVYSTVLIVEDQTDHVLGIWGPDAEERADFLPSLFRRSFVTPSATLMRRRVLADVGAWNTACRYCEDVDYWLRCAAAHKRFHCVGGCHCLYRKNHNGATTHKQCGLLEEVAEVTAQFIRMPGLPERLTRKYAARAYALAARLHATSDPLRDPSADPLRSSRLMWKAWRLRPRTVKYLWRAARHAAADLFRGRRPTPKPPAIAAPVVEPSASVAA